MSSTETLDRGLSHLLKNNMDLADDPRYQEMLPEKERLLAPKLVSEAGSPKFLLFSFPANKIENIKFSW